MHGQGLCVLLASLGFLIGYASIPGAPFGILLGFAVIAVAVLRFRWLLTLQKAFVRLRQLLEKLPAHRDDSFLKSLQEARSPSNRFNSAEWKSLYELHYDRVLAAMIGDGIDSEEQSWLISIASALGLSNSDRLNLNLERMRLLLWEMMADQEVTGAEESLVSQLLVPLAISKAALETEFDAWSQFVRFRNLPRELPAIDDAPKLQRGEVCHHHTTGSLLEKKAVRSYVSGGQRFKEEDLVPTRQGDIYITSKRILVVGDGTIAIPHAKLLDVEIDCDSRLITLIKDGRQKPIYLRASDAIYCGKLIERLATEVPDSHDVKTSSD